MTVTGNHQSNLVQTLMVVMLLVMSSGGTSTKYVRNVRWHLTVLTAQNMLYSVK